MYTMFLSVGGVELYSLNFMADSREHAEKKMKELLKLMSPVVECKVYPFSRMNGEGFTVTIDKPEAIQKRRRSRDTDSDKGGDEWGGGQMCSNGGPYIP